MRARECRSEWTLRCIAEAQWALPPVRGIRQAGTAGCHMLQWAVRLSLMARGMPFGERNSWARDEMCWVAFVILMKDLVIGFVLFISVETRPVATTWTSREAPGSRRAANFTHGLVDALAGGVQVDESAWRQLG